MTALYPSVPQEEAIDVFYQELKNDKEREKENQDKAREKI